MADAPAAPAAPDFAPSTSGDLVNADDATFAQVLGLGEIGAEESTTATETPGDADAPARGEDGRFLPRAGSETDAELVDGDDTDPAPEGGTADADPDPSSEAAAAGSKKGLAPFVARGADGVEIEVPDDMMIEFKADGQERRLPLDKLIRHAQNGFYNERLQQEVEQTRAERPVLQQRVTAVEGDLRAQLAFTQRLMEDETFFLETREKYDQQNTPEARVARDRAAVQREREQLTQQRETGLQQQFIEQQLEPAMNTLLERYPTVSFEELFGRFTLATQPMLVGGRIPVDQLSRTLDILDSELEPWAQQRHDARETTTRGHEQTLETVNRAAKEKVTQMKRTLSRVATPAGNRSSASRPAAKPIVNVDDGINSILTDLAREA